MKRMAVPKRAAQPAQQLEQLLLAQHVEAGRGLVGDDEPRPVDDRHRDHHTLPHAAAELVRVGAARSAGMPTAVSASTAR